jgi:membrane-bound metal-dependent hydrolase YbcI (DUF457 family)
MHILSHLGSGVCIGSVAACVWPRCTPRPAIATGALVGLGAMVVDLDGISLLCDHRVYYGSFWYSHHGAMHSVVGTAILAVLLTPPFAMAMRGRWRCTRLQAAWPWLWLGGVLHLIEDLPAPAGPWGGLMLLWPFSDVRFGGWGWIWWMNEYLMVVLFGGAVLSCSIWLVVGRRFEAWPLRARLLLASLHAWPLILACRFVWMGGFVDPNQWANHQKALLGEPLYSAARAINAAIEPWWTRPPL